MRTTTRCLGLCLCLAGTVTADELQNSRARLRAMQQGARSRVAGQTRRATAQLQKRSRQALDSLRAVQARQEQRLRNDVRETVLNDVRTSRLLRDAQRVQAEARARAQDVARRAGLPRPERSPSAGGRKTSADELKTGNRPESGPAAPQSTASGRQLLRRVERLRTELGTLRDRLRVAR